MQQLIVVQHQQNVYSAPKQVNTIYCAGWRKGLFVFLLQSFIKNICASAHELRQLKVCATANRQGLPFVAGKAPYSSACWLGKLSVSGFWWVAAKVISGFCKVCAAAKCYRATAHRFHRQPRRCAKPLKKNIACWATVQGGWQA